MTQQTIQPTPASRLGLRAPPRRTALYLAVLGALAFIGYHLLTHADTLTERDSTNLARALVNYDVRLHQPHPPGYPLLVGFAHALGFLGEPLNAYLGVAFILSVVALVATYFLGREMFGPRAGIVAALLLLAVPMFSYYADMASTYPGEYAMAPIVALLAYRVARRRGDRSAFLLFPVLAIAGGFRPTVMGLLLPMCLLALVIGRPRLKPLLAGAGVGALVVLAWAIPMLAESGGLSAYRKTSADLYDGARARTSIFYGARRFQAGYNAWHAVVATFSVMLPALLVAPLALPGVRRLVAGPGRFRRWARSDGAVAWWLLLAWFLPYFLLYVFVHFGKPGYAMAYAPAAAVAGAGLVRKIPRAAWAAGAVAAASLLFYAFAPAPELPKRVGVFFPTADSLHVYDREARGLERVGATCPRAGCTLVSLNASDRFWFRYPSELRDAYAKNDRWLRSEAIVSNHLPLSGSVVWAGEQVPASVAAHSRLVGHSGEWWFCRSDPAQTRAIVAEGKLTTDPADGITSAAAACKP
ncbi:MAG: ArnT family glycosyltransferase [Thermoleophilaceae bacterium]